MVLTANSSGCKIGDLVALFFLCDFNGLSEECEVAPDPMNHSKLCVCCMARMRSLLLRLLAPQADATGSVKIPTAARPAGSTQLSLLCLASVMCLKDSRHVSVITGLQ